MTVFRPGFSNRNDDSHKKLINVGGLHHYVNFITPDQEVELLSMIDRQEWRHDLKRRVQHYGFLYDYRARSISKEMSLGHLPRWLDSISIQLVKQGFFETAPDQIIVNEYLPGQGISAHIDCLPCFGNTIASLSLGGAIEMNFTKQDNMHSLYLEPRSLLVLNNEARYEWKHSIANRKSDMLCGKRVKRTRRVSLTFRSVILDEG